MAYAGLEKQRHRHVEKLDVVQDHEQKIKLSLTCISKMLFAKIQERLPDATLPPTERY